MQNVTTLNKVINYDTNHNLANHRICGFEIEILLESLF
jgi:hypothetical protein